VVIDRLNALSGASPPWRWVLLGQVVEGVVRLHQLQHAVPGHRMDDDQAMTPAEMNRGQCADFLRQIEVKRISGGVRKREKTFAASSFSADEKDGGPTLKLLRGEIDKWLQSHPETNLEVPTQLVRDVRKGSRIIATHRVGVEPGEAAGGWTRTEIASWMR
jgi:hypothetical protein